MITIRRAIYEDIPLIMAFIDEYWKKGHILARDREFFEWQYVDDSGVNVYIGIDEESQTIYGIEGVIKYNRSDNPDASCGMWKTIKSENPLLGMDIDDFLWRDLNARYACSAGLTNKAIKIHQLQGRSPLTMDHYYMLGDKSDYCIADIHKKVIKEVKDTGCHLAPIHSVEEMKQVISEETLLSYVLSKDYEYIRKRYFEHPVYRYDVWKIYSDRKETESVIITREEEVNGNKACKIIDFYGNVNDLGEIGFSLRRLIEENDYEYIDIYSFGVPTELYEKAGFIKLKVDDVNIIPNYFHPFEQRNVSISLMEPGIDGIRIFRGDGDQDRPC
ncbi:MAG: hypothetical protein J1F02_05195 [Lachnospiraceae bacterium]|nr:hypothetical protein [Lachnospiraceae bacterium]